MESSQPPPPVPSPEPAASSPGGPPVPPYTAPSATSLAPVPGAEAAPGQAPPGQAAPGQAPPGQAAPGQAAPGQAPWDGQPRWTPGTVLATFVLAIVAIFIAAGVLAAMFVAGGVDPDSLEDLPGFTISATFVQDAILVAAAIIAASRLGRPTAELFGFRSVGAAAAGWTALAFVSYLVLTYLYALVVNLPKESQLFAENPDVVVAVITGLFAIAIAPVVEELFFRGFVYQGLRGRLGVAGAALLSGAIFGGIHLETASQMGLLAIFGVVLALLFEKTRSLWPCIALHGINNTIAFIIVMSS